MKITKVFSVIFLAIYAVSLQVNACRSDSSCGYYKYCCNRKQFQASVCRSSCSGLSCDSSSDCAPSESCCDGECRNNIGSCIPGWVIVLVGILCAGAVIFFIGAVIYRCCYLPSRRRAHEGVIVSQPLTTVLPNQQQVQQPHIQQGQPMGIQLIQTPHNQPSQYQPPSVMTPMY